MSSKEENIIGKEQKQKIEYVVVKNSWLESVIKKKGFDVTGIEDKGIVTAQLRVKLPKSSEEITIVVWKEDFIGNLLTPWMNFQHKNIMPLLHKESIPSLNAFLIYSIPADATLERKINSKKFRCDKNSLTNLVLYMIEVARGINHLHEKGFAHLNVKPSSISIFKDGSIKVDQLHFLSPVNSSSSRNGLPQSLCPPETFFDRESGFKYPKQFDTWSVGIMIAELFTGGYLKKKLPKFVESWCLQVYPVIFKVLKKKKFEKLVHKNFPGASHRIDLKYIRYLVMNILSLHPKARPSIEDIHQKLTNWIMEKDFEKNAGYSVKPKIWKRKLHWIELMRETTQVTLEAQEDLNDTLFTVSESSLKNNDKIERVTAKTVTQSKDLTDDPYKVLREEILECFGGTIPKFHPHEDIESSKTSLTRENDRKENFIRDKEFKTEKESAVSESSLKNNDKLEHVTAKTVIQCKEDLPDDPYKVLREEILECFGGTIPKVHPHEDIESSKTSLTRENDRKENFIRDKEFKREKEMDNYTSDSEELIENPFTALRKEMLDYFGGRIPNVPAEEDKECSKLYSPTETDKECADKVTLDEKCNENGNACRGNIFSKLITFGNSTLKYLSDPWSAENPSTYLNKLSEKLTR